MSRQNGDGCVADAFMNAAWAERKSDALQNAVGDGPGDLVKAAVKEFVVRIRIDKSHFY